jgi:hypothetical protein
MNNMKRFRYRICFARFKRLVSGAMSFKLYSTLSAANTDVLEKVVDIHAYPMSEME